MIYLREQRSVLMIIFYLVCFNFQMIVQHSLLALVHLALLVSAGSKNVSSYLMQA